MEKVRLTDFQLEALLATVQISGKLHKPVTAKLLHQSGSLAHLKVHRSYFYTALKTLESRGLLKLLSENKYSVTPKGRSVARDPSKFRAKRATKEPEDIRGICESCRRFKPTIKFGNKYICQDCLNPKFQKQSVVDFLSNQYNIGEESPVRLNRRWN